LRLSAVPRAKSRLRALTTTSIALLLLVWPSPAGSADEKHLTVYAASANYSLSIADRNGREYIGLLEILEPLGGVSAKTDGLRWKLRFKDVDAEFIQGRDRAKIRGRDAALFGPFLLESGHGMVPLVSLSSLLPRFVGGPVTFAEPSRRLFIGNVATRFTAEIGPSTSSRLVLNFSAPVNPTIATEPGRLRMVFRREPVISPGTAMMRFDNPTIPYATYSEANGQVEIDVNSNAPLMASFSNEGRTISISAVQQPPPVPPPAQAPQMPATEPLAPPVLPGAPAPAPIPRHFFAVIDASHGGDDRGVTLSDTLLEKDVTLGFARQLRQELQNRGISALVLRDSDATLTSEQRAIFANTAHPVIYIAMHAASDGHGVRLYTAMLPVSGENNGPFASWETAQAAFLPASQSALDGIAAELRRRQIPVRTLSAPLRPLNNVTAAAVAVEIAPPGTNVAELASSAYQQSLASILANGIAAARDKMGAVR
jgi:N-acetylmuramoyl-L-alanine amidase